MKPQPTTHKASQLAKTKLRFGAALVTLTSLAVLLSSCHNAPHWLRADRLF